MEKGEKLFALSAIIIMVTAAFSSMLLMKNVTAETPIDWYKTVSRCTIECFQGNVKWKPKSLWGRNVGDEERDDSQNPTQHNQR